LDEEPDSSLGLSVAELAATVSKLSLGRVAGRGGMSGLAADSALASSLGSGSSAEHK